MTAQDVRDWMKDLGRPKFTDISNHLTKTKFASVMLRKERLVLHEGLAPWLDFHTSYRLNSAELSRHTPREVVDTLVRERRDALLRMIEGFEKTFLDFAERFSVSPTGTTLRLADACYEDLGENGELSEGRLSILADAIEEGGCTNQDLLGHLRSGTHFQPCFGVQCALGYHADPLLWRTRILRGEWLKEQSLVDATNHNSLMVFLSCCVYFEPATERAQEVVPDVIAGA